MRERAHRIRSVVDIYLCVERPRSTDTDNRKLSDNINMVSVCAFECAEREAAGCHSNNGNDGAHACVFPLRIAPLPKTRNVS